MSPHHRIEPSAEPSHRSLALARSAAHFCGFRSSESKAVRTYITYSRTRDSIPSLAFIAKKIGLEVKANNPTVAPPTQEVVKSIARSFLLLSIANFKLLAASFRTSVVSFHAPHNDLRKQGTCRGRPWRARLQRRGVGGQDEEEGQPQQQRAPKNKPPKPIVAV